jgi:hypothetical protein
MVIGLGLLFLVQVFVWWSLYIPHGIRAYYFYITPVMALIAVPRLISHLEAQVRMPRLPSLILSVCFTGFLTLRLLLPPDWTRAHAEGFQSFLDHSRQASEWLKNNTPPGTRYAMADRSGVMGFLLRRPIFQLEGLVNTPDYLQDMATGRVDTGYLLDRGVTIFIRSEPGELPHDSANCIVAPVFGGNWPQPRFRLCPEDLLWRSENRDSIVTVWRLQRRAFD